MVGNDNSLIVICLGCLDDILHAIIHRMHGLCYCVIYTSVSHHVAIGEVNHDKVILLGIDGTHKLVLYLVSRHLGLEVVCCNFRRGHKDAVLIIIRSLATTIEEEGHMGILLGLGSMQLLLALTAEIFAKGVGNILLGEDDIHALE